MCTCVRLRPACLVATALESAAAVRFSSCVTEQDGARRFKWAQTEFHTPGFIQSPSRTAFKQKIIIQGPSRHGLPRKLQGYRHPHSNARLRRGDHEPFPSVGRGASFFRRSPFAPCDHQNKACQSRYSSRLPILSSRGR